MTKAAARAKMDEAVKAARAAESRAWKVWCGTVVAAAKANAEVAQAIS